MNIFQLLQQDHLEIDRLLTRLQQPPGAANFDQSGRKYLLGRLVSEASRHEAAEELTFWPHVRRRVPEGGDLADRALQAERDAKAMLDLLKTMHTEEEVIATCAELHALLRAHARFEEDMVFPRLRRYTTPIWAAATAVRFRIARRGAPTRPHPKGPDRPVGLLTLGAPAVMLDHLRDLRHRQRRRPVGFQEPGRADAVAVIREDHERIGALLNRMESQEDPDDTLLRSAIREISIHDAIERQHLYPAIRQRLADGSARYQHLLNEHGQIGRLAANLDAYRFHDDARRAWVSELIVTVRTHVEQEESGVLPALAARMTHEELVDLGDLLANARHKAPTRPHPHAAGAGAAARLSGLVARPLDRARDVLAGRRTA